MRCLRLAAIAHVYSILLCFARYSCLLARTTYGTRDKSSAPPLVRVNRGACSVWGDMKNPRRPHPSGSREPGEPSPTSVLSTNVVTLHGPISSSWPTRPKWPPAAVACLGYIQDSRQLGLGTPPGQEITPHVNRGFLTYR